MEQNKPSRHLLTKLIERHKGSNYYLYCYYYELPYWQGQTLSRLFDEFQKKTDYNGTKKDCIKYIIENWDNPVDRITVAVNGRHIFFPVRYTVG